MLPRGVYTVQEGLLAGSYPREVGLQQLLTAGVNLFLDLTEAGELPAYGPALPPGVEHLRMPIPDFGTPSVAGMDRILQVLEAALAGGRTVYLHCWGGIGRTGTVVGCHLVRQGRTGEQALLELRRLRLAAGCDPDSPESEAQFELVRGWPREQDRRSTTS